MNTEYLPSFVKDLKALKSTPVFESIKALVFEEIPNLPSFEDILNLKKLKGYENAYRIRVGDYRIGFTFDCETVIFYRVLHRKEFYRYFP
ncbi:type II toxin-antitoxin system RelE/ParE family toxin [Phormidium sp. LEGE 05292]|uniref:type II toxin-antitoxin system RelE family toxin n=1 Tax=[Phormidium] sp. LEGE 05292 TaxID=767427 RepID=UPI001881867E|nr:type II toxin-antitoxin system RelE/ParE family toxin [Phormidium sp. LEGE 05292]MBE9226571.1 type II toxin-antitoxin system RelE/ParE family toxin [Phormidium sp. LEGE 05292]